MTAVQPPPLAQLIGGAVASPFARLRELLDGIEPGAAPIDLALGAPREEPPEAIAALMASASDSLRCYPAIRGERALREAIAAWLARRYALCFTIDPERHILPVNGSREGLFYAILAGVGHKALGRPAVLVPQPAYPVYVAAALAANAVPVGLPVTSADGDLPDLAALNGQGDLLARTAVMVLCSPANPQGAVADRRYLAQALALARRHGFLLIVDECYSEIYDCDPPPGAMEAACGCENLLIFNSLSKRSNLPGLRSGFCAGDIDVIDRLAALRNVAGPQMPGPVQAASVAAWSDEVHVERTRQAYRRKFDIADRYLAGRWGYRRPAAGFFLWLDTAPMTGTAFVRNAWRNHGVQLLPGAFTACCPDTPVGEAEFRARLALVETDNVLADALQRLARMPAAAAA